MRDPFAWSFPIGRLFGIAVRVHVLFPVIVLGMFLFAIKEDASYWVDVLAVIALLFVSVFLHELGHCFAGRAVGGEATEILIWPLGGLATVEVPHTPRANLITTIGGPAVNLVLCVIAALVLAFAFPINLRPPFNPAAPPYFSIEAWGTATGAISFDVWTKFFTYLFWVNWVLLLFNVLILGFPFDGGRILQCVLWSRVGYRQATHMAIMTGFGFMFLLAIASLALNSTLLTMVAMFVAYRCYAEYYQLETGGEEGLFGYDFSQGYTSLEKDHPAPPAPRKKQANFIQRWLQRRATKKLLREQRRQEEEEQRMDQLLQKIAQSGKQSLTDEEQRFLKRVSDRYRNRH